MESMRYLVIRHAETDANRLTRALYGKRGAPLNEIGRHHAKLLSATLKVMGIDVAILE